MCGAHGQTNLRLPLPWQIIESNLSDLTQGDLDDFARKQYSASCYPLSERDTGSDHLTDPLEVQFNHFQDLQSTRGLPARLKPCDRFPFTERRARKRIVDIAHIETPQQTSVMILRINNLDINLRLLVHRSPGIPQEKVEGKGKWSEIRAKFVKRLRHGR